MYFWILIPCYFTQIWRGSEGLWAHFFLFIWVSIILFIWFISQWQDNTLVLNTFSTHYTFCTWHGLNTCLLIYHLNGWATPIICGHKVIHFLQIGLQMTAYSIWHLQQKVLGIQRSNILGILFQFWCWRKTPVPTPQPPQKNLWLHLEASERQVLFVFRKGAILAERHNFLSPCVW